MIDVDTNNHSVFRLTYHLILKEYFWSPSYCLITTGGAPLEVIKEYIQTQGKPTGKGQQRVIRVCKTKFKTGKGALNRLFACNRISGEIWSDCLRIAGEHHKKTGKWIDKTELQKAVKRKYPLHSQSIQGVVHKYLQAREGARQARAKGVSVHPIRDGAGRFCI